MTDIVTITATPDGPGAPFVFHCVMESRLSPVSSSRIGYGVVLDCGSPSLEQSSEARITGPGGLSAWAERDICDEATVEELACVRTESPPTTGFGSKSCGGPCRAGTYTVHGSHQVTFPLAGYIYSYETSVGSASCVLFELINLTCTTSYSRGLYGPIT